MTELITPRMIKTGIIAHRRSYDARASVQASTSEIALRITTRTYLKYDLSLRVDALDVVANRGTYDVKRVVTRNVAIFYGLFIEKPTFILNDNYNSSGFSNILNQDKIELLPANTRVDHQREFITVDIRCYEYPSSKQYIHKVKVYRVL